MRLGLCGLGTVGGGLYNLLASNRAEIERRLPGGLELAHLGCRRDNPACDLTGVKVSRDVFAVVRDPEVQIVCELIGGTDTALELARQAIAAGKHLVTANKALIALHGRELLAAADQAGVQVRYEAAVAGGIPIVKALREGLAGNRIESVAGIINGTCNFILTEMAAAEGAAYAQALAEAQRLGYAEADPSFDVEGIDAAHKLTILATLAFGIPLDFAAVQTEGISALTLDDMRFAEELGYRIRHLGIARRRPEGVELRAHPCLVPSGHLLAQVAGVMNAVLVTADAAGPTLYHGAGAGAGPTASAVLADLMDLVRSQGAGPLPNLGFNSLAELPLIPQGETRHACYLNLAVEDKPGVMAQVSGVLSSHEVSIEALVQKDAQGGDAKIVILTNQVPEAVMDACRADLAALATVRQPPTRIRIADL